MNKKVISEQVISDQAPGEQAAPEPAVESPYFTLGKWQGFVQWKCPFCPWDTLEGEQVALEHYNERHAAQTAPPENPNPTGAILIANRFGDEL